MVGLGNGFEVFVGLCEFNGLFSCFVSSLEALSGVGVGCQQTTERSKISFSPVARGIIEDTPLEHTRILAVWREILDILEKIRV